MNVDKSRVIASNGQYSRRPLGDFAAGMAHLGLRGVDFVPHPPHFFCGYRHHEETADLKAFLAENGLHVAVLTPRGYRCALCAADAVQRAGTASYYKSCIALAADLNCQKLVLTAAGACWDISREELTDNAVAMLRELCPVAQSCGVKLLLAPAMGESAPLIAESPVLNTAAELAGVLARVDSDVLGVCLDTNAMSINGDTLQGWFDLLSARTQLVRLCDGNYHGYRAWGEGVVPMERYLRDLETLGYGGVISLYLPGERYIDDPAYPDRVTLSHLCGEVSV